ncbi:hypothetical protein GEMRC1_005059 [Eukaryota sp. GEM-RC1]
MTLRYAAPEQFDNIVTPQSDIYSLGIVLYELFQNREAFQEMSVFGLVGAKQRGISLSFDKTVPSQLAKVINGCLNSDPKLRPKISQIIEILDKLNLAKPLPQQLDHSSLQELECLGQKNQSQTDQILLLQDKFRELIKQINDLKNANFQRSKFVSNLEHDFNHEKQLFIETNRQLQTDINCLKSQIEGFQNQHVISNQHLRSGDGIHWKKLKPKVKKLCEDVRGGKVTSVDLRNSSIGVTGTILLAEALKVNASVTSVNLVGDCVQTEGARALAEALKVNTSIVSIDLSRTCIGWKGARALAEALKVNSSLAIINLYGNAFGVKGVRALADALKVNPRLKIEGVILD